MKSFGIKPITPFIGAEISGVDLGQPLTRECQDAIYQALIDYLVIFFREQPIEPVQHLAFAETFGELEEPHIHYRHVNGFENILILQNDPDNPDGTDVWHSDVSYKENPPFASILWANQVPDCGGDTVWGNMYAAYEALSPELQKYLESLKAVHDFGDFRNMYFNGEVNNAEMNQATHKFGCAIHDVVKTHPITNRKYLFVNQAFTTHILGKSSERSRNLLGYLLNHINQPEFQVRFQWQKHSIAMWDNRCTQHYAVTDYGDSKRIMHRVTVINDRRSF